MSDFGFSFDDLMDSAGDSVLPSNFSQAVLREHGKDNGPTETTRSSSTSSGREFNVFSFSELLQGKAIFGEGSDVLKVLSNYAGSLLSGTIGIGGNTDQKLGGGFDNLLPQDIKSQAAKLRAAGVGSEIGKATAAAGGTGTTTPSTDPNAPPASTPPPAPTPGGPPPSGTVQELAAQIYNHPSITFDYGKSGNIGTQFRILSEGGQLPMGCPGSSPRAELLGLIIGIANRFPIQISSFVRPGDGCGGHGGGFCVDIDGCDGSIGISGSDERSNKIVSTAIELMDTSYSLGFGRGYRTTPLPPAPPGKRVYDFNDNANHVHIQLKD